ncbi:hypothetical protein [Paraflavitalea speifideaquila]|uniref:hypothetical protein n=1 Tax=Paraflavitalea speifideaquila TaxID=3076558 RepID=UPI0028E34512|nr:hypothetical protein [Paraflavitalea speifideiaquila]
MNKSTYAGLMGSGVLICLFFLSACDMPTVKPPEKDIVEVPEKFEVRVSDNLRKALTFIIDNKDG